MATESPGSKLVAVLYADVVGYSRLTSTDEEGTYRNLVSRMAELSSDIEHYGGTTVNFAGDAMLAYFSSATAALACAIAFQPRAVRNHAEEAGRKLEFRIGINLGDVFFDDDGLRRGIYGQGVNIAARLQALAEAGGISVSDAVRLAIGTRVPVQLLFRRPTARQEHPRAGSGL